VPWLIVEGSFDIPFQRDTTPGGYQWFLPLALDGRSTEGWKQDQAVKELRGEAGSAGKASVIRAGGSVEKIPGKFSTRLRKGERIRIESPGGGGWGSASTK